MVGGLAAAALQRLSVTAEWITTSTSFASAGSFTFGFAEERRLTVVSPAALALRRRAAVLEAWSLTNVIAPALLVRLVALVQVLADVILCPAPHVWLVSKPQDLMSILGVVVIVHRGVRAQELVEHVQDLPSTEHVRVIGKL